MGVTEDPLVNVKKGFEQLSSLFVMRDRLFILLVEKGQAA